MAELAVRAMTRISAVSRSPAGFTLLELMVVLAILAMGSILVIPSITGMSSRTFNAQVREVSALLNYTRRTAIVTGQPATARFFAETAQTDSSQGRAADSAPSALGRDETWTARGLELAWRDSTNQTRAVAESVDVTFYPEGGSTGGALILGLNQRQVSVTVDPFSGKVSTEFDDD
jgi:type II secretion system protein H